MPSALARMMANSSPPMRAVVSPLRTERRRAQPNERSMSSPTAWPSLSLTALKPSRSISTNVNAQPYRALCTAAVRRAASKCRRLAMLVSGSWSALWRARCSVSASWHTLRTTSRTTLGTTSGSQKTPGHVGRAGRRIAVEALLAQPEGLGAERLVAQDHHGVGELVAPGQAGRGPSR